MPDKRRSVAVRWERWLPTVVWLLRIVVGGTFLVSGLAKALDLWGFVFKIEDYLVVWDLSQPRSVVFMVAMLISSYEFVFGSLLLIGCYKRLAPWALGLTMIVWLPLTCYLWIANPVADCGCFGDFWVISNFWTFIKNLVLTAMLGVLIRYNSQVRNGLYQPAIQWIVGAILSLYIIIVGLYGYNVQPMVDFRHYPVGSKLLDAEDDEAEDADFNELCIFDEEDEDVTEDILDDDRPKILLVIPEAERIDISYSSFLNDLYQWASDHDEKMVCLIGANRAAIELWKDLSMASYPIYSADDTVLKELSRGTMSVVYLSADNRIQTKFTLSSIPGDILDQAPQGEDFVMQIAPQPGRWFKVLTGGSVVILLLIFLFQSLILTVSRWIRRKCQKKEVNLQSQTGSNCARPETEQNNNT